MAKFHAQICQFSAFHQTATKEQAQAACGDGKTYKHHISDTDVERDAMPVGYTGMGHQGRAMFTCPQPECSVARDLPILFATLEQRMAHWNTFHVAVAPQFSCMVHDCDFVAAAAPNSLDVLFHHIIEKHPAVYDNGAWHNLEDMVEQGLKVEVNPQYWPLEHPLGELQ